MLDTIERKRRELANFRKHAQEHRNNQGHAAEDEISPIELAKKAAADKTLMFLKNSGVLGDFEEIACLVNSKIDISGAKARISWSEEGNRYDNRQYYNWHAIELAVNHDNNTVEIYGGGIPIPPFDGAKHTIVGHPKDGKDFKGKFTYNDLISKKEEVRNALAEAYLDSKYIDGETSGTYSRIYPGYSPYRGDEPH